MDYNKAFKQMFDDATEVGGLDEAKEKVREALDGDRHYYTDVSGDGTEYVCAGTRSGVGFATCHVRLLEDATCVVAIESVCVPEDYRRDVEKLCRIWNKRFRLKGLEVEDGRLCFVTAPFDPLGGGIGVDMAVGIGFCTIRQFAGVVLALECGTMPWDLIDYGYGDDDEDDGGGESVPDPDELLARLRASITHTMAHMA